MKDKIIEEMARIMCSPCPDGKECSGTWCYKRVLDCANEFYNQGYRKLPKDSTVLSREEYERLKRVESEKDRLYEIKLDLENQLIEKGWTDYEGADEIEKRVSKETAEKLIKFVSEHCDNETLIWQLDEFVAKQFEVEIME